MPNNVVLRDNLDDDAVFDEVKDKIRIEAALEGLGAPTDPPPVPEKVWIYVDKGEDPVALYAWDTAAEDWFPAGGSSGGGGGAALKPAFSDGGATTDPETSPLVGLLVDVFGYTAGTLDPSSVLDQPNLVTLRSPDADQGNTGYVSRHQLADFRNERGLALAGLHFERLDESPSEHTFIFALVSDGDTVGSAYNGGGWSSNTPQDVGSSLGLPGKAVGSLNPNSTTDIYFEYPLVASSTAIFLEFLVTQGNPEPAYVGVMEATFSVTPIYATLADDSYSPTDESDLWETLPAGDSPQRVRQALDYLVSGVGEARTFRKVEYIALTTDVGENDFLVVSNTGAIERVAWGAEPGRKVFVISDKTVMEMTDTIPVPNETQIGIYFSSYGGGAAYEGVYAVHPGGDAPAAVIYPQGKLSSRDVTADIEVWLYDQIIGANTTAGPIDIDLSTLTQVGRSVIIDNIGTDNNDVTLLGTVSGAVNPTLSDGESITVYVGPGAVLRRH